jgi:hypothetical protein
MASRSHQQTSVSVKGKKKASGKKIRHALIRQTDDGKFLSEIHHDAEKPEDQWSMKPEEASHETFADAADHVGQQFGAPPMQQNDDADENEEAEE